MTRSDRWIFAGSFILLPVMVALVAATSHELCSKGTVMAEGGEEGLDAQGIPWSLAWRVVCDPVEGVPPFSAQISRPVLNLAHWDEIGRAQHVESAGALAMAELAKLVPA